jgi:hypothetical protein
MFKIVTAGPAVSLVLLAILSARDRAHGNQVPKRLKPFGLPKDVTRDRTTEIAVPLLATEGDLTKRQNISG